MVRRESVDVLFSPQELAILAAIESPQTDEPVCVAEMRCQSDMIVRGRRLWDYHRRLGDLADFLPIEMVA